MNRYLEKGYSLIELLVVLAILVLVIAIIPLKIPSVIASVNVKTATRELASSLKQAQSLAINKNAEASLSLNVEQHNYVLDNKKVQLKLPDAASLSLITARSEQLSDVEGKIRFFPDGSSTGGQIKLSHINQEYVVDVHWLTGKVRILP